MAKIDSVGRMRLPPDSGIRTQAHSRREHATSEPVKRAMTEWFQTIQGARREASDEALTQAIRHALTDRVNRGEATPKVLPIQVLTTLPAEGSDRHLYQVQLGQSLLTLSSKVPLQPGQTLVVTPGKNGPVVVNPVLPEHQSLVRALSQQQQLQWLPAPQGRTPLSALIPWMPPQPITSGQAEHARQASALADNRALNPSSNWNSTLSAGGNLPTVSWLAQALQQVLSQWQQSLANAANLRWEAASGSGAPAQTTATPAGQAGVGSSPFASAGSTTAAGNNGIALSDHWIPQLVRTATQQFGEATPQTVRLVFQSWQQAASNQARSLPLPDLSQVNLRPANNTMSASLQPAPLLPTPPAISSSNAAPAPASTGGGQTAVPTSTQPSAQTPTQPPMLADLAPVLRVRAERSDRAADPGGDRLPIRIPADIWRLAAEQLIDQRLQQLGQTPQHSLQEALQRRAEQLLRQVTTTYSPAQLKQQFQQRGMAQGGMPPGGSSQATEQQALLQVRQLLEQVSQQQQVRTLTPSQADTPNDQPRQLQGIPLLADQQLVWFDLERQPSEPASGDPDTKSREWILDLHFQLPPMAPVCARLRWHQDHARLEMLTDDTPTLRLMHSHLQGLQERLNELQLPVEEVQVRHGLPRRINKTSVDSPANDLSSRHIDIKT